MPARSSSPAIVDQAFKLEVKYIDGHRGEVPITEGLADKQQEKNKNKHSPHRIEGTS